MESSPTSSQPGGDRTAEILTLVLRLLEGDPRLSASFQQLRSDVEASALLGHSVDWQGSATPLSYARALQRLGDAAPAPTQLQSLLGRLMELTLQSVDASSRLPSIPLSLLRSDGLSIASTGTNGEAWSAAYRRQLSLFQETCLRGRAAASSTTLLLAREIGARVPGRARPPKYCFSSAISDLDEECAPKLMRPLCTLCGHRLPVYCCIFDRSGRRILTGSDDCNIKMWDVRSGLLQRTFRGHVHAISEMCTSPCNTWLASSSVDGTVRVWQLSTGASEAVFTLQASSEGTPPAVNAISFPARVAARRFVALGEDSSVVLFDPSDWKAPKQVLRAAPAPMIGGGRVSASCCVTSPTGRVVAIGISAPPYLLAWPIEDGAAIQQPPHNALVGHFEEVTTACFSHRGDILLSGSHDGTAKAWRWRGHLAEWNCITLAPTETARMLAHESVVAANPGVKQLAVYVDTVAFSRDDRFAFTSESLHKQTRDSPCLSSCVRVWRLPPGCTAGLWKAGQFATLVHTLQPPESTKPVFVVAPHPSDASLLATAGYDGLLRVWDVHSGSQLCQMRSASRAPTLPAAENEALLDAIWSPDGTSVGASNVEGELLVFGIGTHFQLRNAPTQQFFASDANPLIHDAHHNALDTAHNLQPHRVPRGQLHDLDLIELPAQYQQPAISYGRLETPGFAALQLGLDRQADAERRREAGDASCHSAPAPSSSMSRAESKRPVAARVATLPKAATSQSQPYHRVSSGAAGSTNGGGSSNREGSSPQMRITMDAPRRERQRTALGVPRAEGREGSRAAAATAANALALALASDDEDDDLGGDAGSDWSEEGGGDDAESSSSEGDDGSEDERLDGSDSDASEAAYHRATRSGRTRRRERKSSSRRGSRRQAARGAALAIQAEIGSEVDEAIEAWERQAARRRKHRVEAGAGRVWEAVCT